MTKQRFDIEKNSTLVIAECAGDLVIRPWMESGILVKGDFKVDETDGIVIYSQSDLHVMVPELINIKIENTRGDLLLKGVQGDISIQEVIGDGILTNLNSLKISKVIGDLVARNIDGSLTIGSVHGDVVARNVSGDVSVENIQGDLSAQFITGALRIQEIMGDVNAKTINGEIFIEKGLRDANLNNLGGSCSLQDIRGDIRIKGGLINGEHIFAAQGDIIFRWPSGAPLALTAKGLSIQKRLEFDEVMESNGVLNGRIGDGDTIVSLTAGGRILLKDTQLVNQKWETEPIEDFDMDFTIGFDGLGERISSEMNQQMARLSTDFETKFGPDFAQKMSDKFAQQAEKATRKAEAAAEKARRYAEREAEKAQRMQRTGVGDQNSPTPGKQKPTQQSATAEEQLKILQMVEKGIISPDEANTLLKALEE